MYRRGQATLWPEVPPGPRGPSQNGTQVDPQHLGFRIVGAYYGGKWGPGANRRHAIPTSGLPPESQPVIRGAAVGDCRSPQTQQHSTIEGGEDRPVDGPARRLRGRSTTPWRNSALLALFRTDRGRGSARPDRLGVLILISTVRAEGLSEPDAFRIAFRQLEAILMRVVNRVFWLKAIDEAWQRRLWSGSSGSAGLARPSSGDRLPAPSHSTWNSRGARVVEIGRDFLRVSMAEPWLLDRSTVSEPADC